MSNIFEYVKNAVDIVQLAEHYGAQPYGAGDRLQVKHNPLRDSDDTPSLFLFRHSNTFYDFGSGIGGSVIDFIIALKQCTPLEAVETLADIFNLNITIKNTDNQAYKPTNFIPPQITQIQEQEEDKGYLTPEAVENFWLNSPTLEKINHEKHGEILESITPERMLRTADKIDRLWYWSKIKYSNAHKTAAILPTGINGRAYTIRYRYKEVNGQEKKWVAETGTKANYLYTRIKEDNSFLLIVEGTRDYINAGLLGYSVIALPHANFKELPTELTEGRKLVFICDNDGKNAMAELFDNTKGDKFWLNHEEFSEKNGIKDKCKDLSDYLYKFNSVEEFKKALGDFIKTANGARLRLDKDFNRGNPITILDLFAMPEGDPLVENFLYKGTTTIIHAKPGAGKSVLVLSVIKEVLKGDKIKEVFYFDGDNPPRVLRGRLIHFSDEIGNKKLRYYSSSTMRIEEMISMIEELGSDHYRGQGADKLIVIDTFGKFLNAHTGGKGSVSSDSDVSPLLDKIGNLSKKLDATVIIVHHSNKALSDEGKPVFSGSHRITGDTDGTWGLVRDKKTGVITLYQDKTRYPEIPPILKIKIDLSSYEISKIEALNYEDEERLKEQEELEKQNIRVSKLIENIKEKLNKEKEITFSKLAKATGKNHNNKEKEELKAIIQDNPTLFTIEERGKGLIVKLTQDNGAGDEIF